jgi:hypothetical protein
LNQETNQRGLSNDFDEVASIAPISISSGCSSEGLPLRVGRQNLIRGEGLLLFDGGAYEGSRAMYFNGFNLGYDFRQSRIELTGICAPVSDRFPAPLPQPEPDAPGLGRTGGGRLLANRRQKNLSIESCWSLKKEYHGPTATSTPRAAGAADYAALERHRGIRLPVGRLAAPPRPAIPRRVRLRQTHL